MTKKSPLLEFHEGESGYCVLGANSILSRIGALEDQIEGVRKNEDIEFVHRLRVASRRLRAALPLFRECFPKKLLKKWMRVIKNVTKSSGAARDIDVYTSFLENYSKIVEDKSVLPGVEYLVSQQKAHRAGIQLEVIHVLDALVASSVLRNISDYCMKMKKEVGETCIKTPSTYQKACSHISTRLSNLLTMNQFVHDERAVEKHHKMRIAAKWLRYTMEVFSSLYRGELKDQILLTKQLQDVLGEMHDFDVWIQNLSVNTQSMISDEVGHGLDEVLKYLVERRSSRYKDFVSLWDEAVAKGLFDNIRQVTETGHIEVILELLKCDNPRVALISDIHGNLDALKAIMADAKNLGIEVFLNAGDSVGFGAYPNEVLETLRSTAFLSVIGNFDLEVVEDSQNHLSKKNSAVRVTAEQLSRSGINYLQSLPKELRLEICGRKILVTHGTPDSIEEHIYPNSPVERLNQIAANVNADLVVLGHSHIQLKRDAEGVTFVNPGSVGRPADSDPRAEYAVLSFNPFSVESKRVKYDVEAATNGIRKRRLPENFAQMLLEGVSVDVVKRRENALKKKQMWKSRSTIRKVKRIAETYFSDSHAGQDRKLALKIFDQTRGLHSLGKEERYWLECGAILHDIGLSRGSKGHHKSSLKLVLNDLKFPFTSKERYIIGSIARYHRRALPDKKHYNLAPLDETEIEKVTMLSSILRVADALDFSHSSVVKNLNVNVLPNRIILECLVSGDPRLEDQAVRKKKDLFEKVFRSDLTVTWKPRLSYPYGLTKTTTSRSGA